MDTDSPTFAADLKPSGTISRQSLHGEIVNRLRDMIIEGELLPGARVHEAQMGTQLGVSRTPLREALKYLASEGLVELVPSKGAVVKRFGAKEVQDMLLVIRAMEELAGALACQNGSDADIAEVRRLHDAMMRAYAQGDRLEYFKLNQSIHSAIVAASNNLALINLHALLQSRLKRVRFIGHEGPEKWAAAVAEHEDMIRALEARDAVALPSVLGAHLANAWFRVKDQWDETPT
ncbi:GntR family transcriptional regulator [Aureimonas sp. SA4125]|uniref:GntR family transcriptional regulator n=1 Tax=Aureimonas sp. SA4125 TaxID=2826993 RepID=UPI001CC5E6CA|nr:GntR family transcriptional regulator [Aureimonas sp. SA4125]BDA83009.1 GntR family transcriptional regulator [Aureimonas sp. SA4125]